MKKDRVKVIRRQATLDDVPAIDALDKEVWTEFPGTPEMFASRIKVFPEGNFVAVVEGKIVGYLCEQFIDFDFAHKQPFTWEEITDKGTLVQSHKLNGEYVYGLSMMVSREFQNCGIGTQLILCGWGLMIANKKKGTFIGSRIPDYHTSDKSIEEYVSDVRADGLPVDSELRLYARDGCKRILTLPNYINDPDSRDFGVLVYRYNPFYKWPFRNLIAKIIKDFGPRMIRSGF